MPFNVIWNDDDDCWTVINIETGKVHARCTSLKRAQKQYYLLNRYEDDNCMSKRKSPCIDSPSCTWIVGKGCRPDSDTYRNLPWKHKEKLSPLQRSEKLGMCNRIRTKKKCQEEEKECEWEKGKGCRKIPRRKSPLRRLSLSPKSPSRRLSLSPKSPLRPIRKRRGCSRRRKNDCIISPDCKWTVGKGCSPI